MAPVAAGDAFTELQRREIDKAIDDAERVSGYQFSVYVGGVDGDARQRANALHQQLARPADSILVQVDPNSRTIEVVTGSRASTSLDSRQAGLAVLTMQSAFSTGDLTRGVVEGLHQLAALARREAPLHTDTP